MSSLCSPNTHLKTVIQMELVEQEQGVGFCAELEQHNHAAGDVSVMVYHAW